MYNVYQLREICSQISFSNYQHVDIMTTILYYYFFFKENYNSVHTTNSFVFKSFRKKDFN